MEVDAGPAGQLVHDAVVVHASTSPDAAALISGRQRLTYRQLDRRAARLAERLRCLDVQPDTVVGVCLPRGLLQPVALLGVLYAGGAYLPLDPTHPVERRRAMLRTASAGVLLTTSALAADLAGAGMRTVCLDQPAGAPGWSRESGARRPTLPEHLAYVVFTSGSTGEPKGVMITHRGLANHARAVAGRYGLHPGDHVLQCNSIGFDVAAEELYPTWLAGGCVVLAPNGVMSHSALAALIEAAGVTVVNLPTSYWVHWATELAGARPLPPGLRLVVIGDEAAPAAALVSWREHAVPPVAVMNAYGVTEATITSTVHHATGDSSPPDDIVPIGSPIAGVEAHVLDSRTMTPVPAGVPGELHLGGAGLARGYAGRPDLTADRFRPHPLPPWPGARVYRTGDTVRRRADDVLAFIGRTDDQLQVRGFRIEPAEVAAALAAHPDVRDAHVAGGAGPDGPRLVAYVAPRQPHRIPGPAQLGDFLARRLPAFMLPAAYVVLDDLPRLPSGKVDRRALPDPGGRRPGQPADATAARTSLEATLVRIWREVLGLDRLGIATNLLDLGAHSLLALRAVTRLEAVAGVHVSLQEIYDNPTVERLAAAIGRQRGRRGPAALPAIRPGRAGATGSAPLSLQQEQVWFLQRLAPASAAYHAQTTIRVAGPLDLDALDRALTEIARRHEILRTTFAEIDAEPRQIVHPASPIACVRVDLRHVPEAERPRRLEELVRRELARPFDLTALPLARWTAVRLADDEHELVLVEHHLVHDGWSFTLLMRELTALYGGRPAGGRPLQYADYARWQRRALDSPGMRAQLDYWRRQLADLPPALALPATHSRPRAQGFRGDMLRIELPVGLRAAVREFSRQRGVTLFATLLSAFAALLGRTAGTDDVVVGSGFANRRLRGMDGLLGMAVNTVVLRWRLSETTTGAELVRRTRDLVLEASEHQELPFARVVEALNPERDRARNPLVQAMFSFDDAPLPDVELAGSRATVFERHNGSAKLDLNIIVEPRRERQVGVAGDWADDRLTLLWEYDSDVLDEPAMTAMAGRYQRLLEAMVTEPDRPVAELPLLTESDRRAQARWNPGSGSFPSERCLHELVADRAAAAPDAVAVTFEGAHLRYGDLDRRANRVASHLRRLGVGPETLVGVLLERSLDMVVALLGVLKAGGAYLPLDPAHPDRRLGQVLEDSRVRVLLTRERHLDRLPAYRGRTVCLDRDRPAIDAAPEHVPEAGVRPSHLAYVIYTSGSTGRPKGVMVDHRSVVRLLDATRRWFRFGAADVWTALHSYAFDFSVWELWGALATGGRVVLASESAARSPETVRRLLVECGVTVLNQTPTAFQQLAEVDAAGPPGELRLRVVVLGGEAVRPDALAGWFRRHGDERPRVVNMYGITEGTVHLTYRPLTAADATSGVSPIGSALPDIRLHVLDRGLRQVPAGVAGELCFGGAGLARGYLGQPGLTAERLVPDPITGRPGARLYRTGDLVRYLPDGDLEYLGRLDHQVKVRGYRIELAEIEAVVARHPDVRHAAVIAREDAPGDQRLVAYVVAPPGRALDAGALRAYLAERLPPYMVPAAFVALAALPLTGNGKLDRRALPRPGGGGHDGAFVAPRTPVERAVADVWAAVIGVDRVGLHDDFFERGGHSMLGIKIVARLRAELGVDVPLAALFDHPTVQGLAGAVAERAGSEPAPAMARRSAPPLAE